MNDFDLSLIPTLAVAVSAVFLLVSQNWRWSIAALAIQYLAAFGLAALVWPLSLAVVRLIAGWMALAMLGASRPEEDLLEERVNTAARPLFRVLAAGMVLVLILSVLPQIAELAPVPPRVLEGGLILVGIGLLHLGMTTRPLRVILGLLTVLTGFDLIYAAVETSILIAGVQAVITLGLALVGAYFLASRSMEGGA